MLRIATANAFDEFPLDRLPIKSCCGMGFWIGDKATPR